LSTGRKGGEGNCIEGEEEGYMKLRTITKSTLVRGGREEGNNGRGVGWGG